MIIVFLLTIALAIGIIVECMHMFEQGTPAKDSDILEMLEKYGVDFDVDKKWNDKFKLYASSYKSNAPNIHQTQYSIIFPYYISDVGVIPIWYKSASRLKSMFEEKITASKYTTTKRDKLGLGK
jgi:hypothetical protein